MKQVVIATLSLWLFEVFILVEGHKSIICTSTSPTNPGAFTFWVGTYHENPAAAGVPGNISIREPSGSVPTSGFSAWCSLQDCPTLPCAMNVPGIPGTATVEDFQFEMEKAGHCTAVTDPVSGEALMRTDSVLSCYEVNPGMPGKFGTAVTSGTGTFPPSDTQVQTINCNQPGGNMNGITNEHRTMYGIHIKDVKAGTYETWTFGTNADLDASAKNVAGVDTPCAMDLNAHWKYDISIADGFADCTTNVPVMGFVNPASLTFCNPVMGRKIFSGFVCSAVCNTGYTRVGVPRCFDGQWTPYMCTDKPTCDRPDLSNNASIPGRNFTPSYQYINLVTDGDPGPPTAPGCADVLTMSGTSCNYTCNLDNPGDVTCVPSKSTPITADGTGVRSQIVCGIDGNWYPGEGFCGCRTPPCDTPTPTLSLTPTFSLTPTLTFSLTLTLSLTETLSLTPTPSMTQNPLCVVFEPLGSVFCAEDDVFSIWPWLLLLLLCCVVVACCLHVARRRSTRMMLAKSLMKFSQRPLKQNLLTSMSAQCRFRKNRKSLNRLSNKRLYWSRR
eukprot:TRINITY_DN1427_c0_g3_i2.p1 TRINITY_DN1427_c0_g3~~TRINITY_DN1427_c0_g3_i2.p1  ORF type:complete len:569 (+),score=53.40 TRINITY_DN1427_c0_g3_i2:41-1708(+)